MNNFNILDLNKFNAIKFYGKNHTYKINDEVYIFGNGTNCPQTIYDLAKLADTIPIEILCHTGYRINRTYINR